MLEIYKNVYMHVICYKPFVKLTALLHYKEFLNILYSTNCQPILVSCMIS